MAEWWEELEETTTPAVAEPAAPGGDWIAELEAAETPAPAQPSLLTPEQQAEAPEFNYDMVLREDQGMFEDLGERMLGAFGAMTTVDDDEVAQMLSKYPHIKLQKTEEGTFGINESTGQQFILNRPGFSGRDVVQGITQLLAFTPAGKVPGMAQGVTMKTLGSAAAAGATEAGIQTLQETAGGSYDPWDVVFSAGLAGAFEPIAQGVGAAGRAIAGTDIPQHIKDAMQFAKERGVAITTTDVFQDMLTPAQRILSKMIERMPLTGTGSIKVNQKAERARILDELAAEYDIDPATDFGEAVLSSFNRNRNAALKEATEARRNARARLDQEGAVPTAKALMEVEKLIAQQVDLGSQANPTLVNRLQAIRTDLQEGGRNFGRMIKYRSNLYKAGADFDDPNPTVTKDALKKVGDAISGDMETFAKDKSKVAARQWAKSNKIFREDLAQVKDTQLKKLIQKGDVSPDVANQILDSGKPQILRDFYNKLDPAGQQATRQRLLQGVLEESGWPQSADATKVLRNLEKKKTMRAFNAFFPGVHNKQLDGLKEYLRMTMPAGKIGEGVGMAASGGGGFTIGTGANIATLGIFGALGRGVESKPVRNLLLRLHYAKGNPKAMERVMRQLRPLAQALGEEMTRQQPPQEAPSVQ